MVAKKMIEQLEGHTRSYVNHRSSMQTYFEEYLKILKLMAGVGMISPITQQLNYLKSVAVST